MKHFRSLNKWFELPLGISVAKEFARNIDSIPEFLKGDTLLQLGNCGDNLWLGKFNFNRKWIASPYSVGSKNDIECSLNQLPIARNSLDCVLAPLTLEPFGGSLSLLDEIDRILKPMGIVILVSINPWSLWGGAMKCGLLNCYDNRNVKMRTPFNLNRTFLQRGYRQCSLSNFCYIPPVNNQSLINKLTFFDEVGKMLWPFPSGFYCYVAQKYEMIMPSLRVRASSKEYKTLLQPVIN